VAGAKHRPLTRAVAAPAATQVCFFCGDAAVLAADQTPEDRRAAVVRSVQLMFGPELAPRAGHALAYHEYLWHRDEASNGCVAAAASASTNPPAAR
jgi:monoamine oxidase